MEEIEWVEVNPKVGFWLLKEKQKPGFEKKKIILNKLNSC